ARCSPRADRVGGQKKRRGAGAGTLASTVSAPASAKPPTTPPPVRRLQQPRKPAFAGFSATTAGPTVRPSILSSPSMRRVGGVGGASGSSAAGASAPRSTVGPAAAAAGATAVMPPAAPSLQAAAAVMPPAAPSLQAATAVMPAAAPSLQAAAAVMPAVMPAAVPSGHLFGASVAVAAVVMPPPQPPGQLFGAATALFQTQQLARDDMDVDPSKTERMATAKVMMANALASVAQVKLSLAGTAMSKAEEEARVLQSVIADADLARALAAVEELREAEWVANQMDVDEDGDEGPWPMEVDV
ncbi:unnamed protein product, partial [Ectocarpus fasciculatus]